MSDAASRPADRTRLAWQRSLLLIAGTAAVLYKDASDDGQAGLGAAGSGALLAAAFVLYWMRGRAPLSDATGAPAAANPRGTSAPAAGNPRASRRTAAADPGATSGPAAAAARIVGERGRSAPAPLRAAPPAQRLAAARALLAATLLAAGVSLVVIAATL